ncbi:MAG: NAD-dependent epimerase/dehydratase family protein [Burkholderiales bacterium]
MTTLVVGGAGYIGSHMVKLLLERNAPVIRLDNLSSVADSTLALKELGWKPRYAELETIVTHAWQYHRCRSTQTDTDSEERRMEDHMVIFTYRLQVFRCQLNNNGPIPDRIKFPSDQRKRLRGRCRAQETSLHPLCLNS